MSNEEYENPAGFVRSKLPWLVGAAALVLFFFTLNHWVNLRSLPVSAKVTGWESILPVQSPLFYTITFPLRFLPAAITPLALNVFTALCAALTLMLLARSISLLPHDRTHEQRLRERSEFSLLSIGFAWVPVVLATATCALQLTFWEHATAVTGEMFDLLLFAYVVRCLLEYRILQDERWLAKLAFVYGLAVTNNWALIAFFPLFVIALIWIKGLRLFDPGFLVRTAGLGVLGLLLYFLLPAIWTFKGNGDYSFLEVLRANLANQKKYLIDTPILRNRVLLLSLTSLLPVFLIGIRWPSSFGDTSVAGASLTNLAFRVIHLLFLGGCLFVAFDPKYSPRKLGLGLPFLSFYYLGALAIGYYAGYALLVFTDPPRKSWRGENSVGKLFNPIVRAAVLLALAAVPAGLFYKNYPFVRAADGTVLKEFIAQAAAGLPPAPAYLLSEDPYQLALLQGYLMGAPNRGDYLLVDTRSLERPDYHEQLRKRWGERWPLIAPKEELGSRVAPVDIQRLVYTLATSNTVAYLHPSFGYFFEVLHAERNGQSLILHPFTADEVLPPLLSAAQLQANEAFWAGAMNLTNKLESLKQYESEDGRYVGQSFSRSLNDWGVELQRNGKMAEAGKYFSTAVQLNTNNIPAKFNRDFNLAFLAGDPKAGETGKTMDQKFGTYRSWTTMLQENGPFDHPEFCAMLGDGFLGQNQYRQAALQFSRTVFFEPTNFAARVALGKAYVYGNWPEKGLAEIEKIERDFASPSAAEKSDLIALRAAAYYTARDFPKAEQILTQARSAQPEDGSLTQALFELYRISGKYTNALAVIDQQVRQTPTNLVVLLQKAELQLNNDDLNGAHSTVEQVLNIAPKSGPALLFQAFVFIRQTNYTQAQASLEKVLQVDPENSQALLYRGIVLMEQNQGEKAREAFNSVLEKQPENVAALRNRAILDLRAQRWSQAKEDYLRLRKLTPRSHAVMYGLAEIAYAQKDFIEATRYYENYLRYSPADGSSEIAEEKKKVQERLQELKTVAK
ncbi:MAG TPA: tetratricopeptide repeat protein [Verrucomicrobiae bacterium]|nr:tetratricopeptide repeat protein [Verrucomicrobiae bacterium]